MVKMQTLKPKMTKTTHIQNLLCVLVPDAVGMVAQEDRGGERAGLGATSGVGGAAGGRWMLGSRAVSAAR